MTRPIGITDSQLQMIMRACEPLLPADRDPFLRALARALGGGPQPLGDGAVYRAVKLLQRQYWRPPAVDAGHEARHDRRRVGEPIA
jgi:hypothetical protein